MADITHGTWIKDGKAVDAIYQNGVKVYGRNLLLDSQTQMRRQSWYNINSLWTENWGTYLGSNISRSKSAWNSIRYSYKDLLDRGVINTTDDFTYSLYFRVVGEDPAEMSYAQIIFFSDATMQSGTIPMNLTDLKEGQWARMVVHLNFRDIEYDPKKDYDTSIRMEVSSAPKAAGAWYEFAAIKLERGTTATPYSIAPEDVM